MEAVRKAVEIVTVVDPAAVVLGDEGALTEAVLNVVGNAVKYSREGGRVEVSAERRDGSVVISVSDQGIGIPAADLPRIFDAFYRGQAGERGITGAGIGLALTRRIVEAHDGSITAISDPGTRTTFVIELPEHPAAAQGSGDAPPDQARKEEVG
jgi:signal transduction histidine kinase